MRNEKMSVSFYFCLLVLHNIFDEYDLKKLSLVTTHHMFDACA